MLVLREEVGAHFVELFAGENELSDTVGASVFYDVLKDRVRETEELNHIE